jgi:hypothetical protein
MAEYNVEAVVSILKEIKRVLPMTEDDLYSDNDKSDSEFICDTLSHVVSTGESQEYFMVDREVDAINDKIQDHIGYSFSYVSYLECRDNRTYSFEEGQVARQEFLDRMIDEFLSEKQTAFEASAA